MHKYIMDITETSSHWFIATAVVQHFEPNPLAFAPTETTMIQGLVAMATAGGTAGLADHHPPKQIQWSGLQG